MSLEYLTTIKQETPRKVSWEELTENLEQLLKLIERKGLISGDFREVTTGYDTRVRYEKEVRIRTGRENGLKIIRLQATTVPKGRLLIPIADLTIAVPVSNNFKGVFFRQGREKIDWTNPRTKISFKNHSGTVDLSPNTGNHDQTTASKIIKTAEWTRDLLGRLNGHREMIKDLTGKTLVVD